MTRYDEFRVAVVGAEWEAAVEKARQRQERERRKPLNRLRHWAHARRHPAVHFTRCTCGRRP